MTESRLLDACRTLFGQEINLNREFLYYLQPSGAKLAYRTQVKINHPDRFNDAPHHVRQQQTDRFREIHAAYQLLLSFLDQKQRRPATPPRSAAARTRPSGRAQSTATHTRRAGRRTIPTIPLEFGMYAFYLGKISYQDLIEALIWQRRQRPMLGAIALRWGWLSEAQIGSILAHRGRSMRFGKKAIELGLLSPLQVDAMVRHQRGRQQRIGQYFVTKGLMSAAEADRLASALDQHNQQVMAKARRRAAGERW